MSTITKITLSGVILSSALLTISDRSDAQQASAQPGAVARQPGAVQGAITLTGGGLTDRPDDEKAILAVGQAFRKAFDAGDARAVTALYVQDAEIIDEIGDRIQGRQAIEDAYAGLFQDRKGATIEIMVDSLRFLGADSAKEEGRTRIKLADSSEPPSVRHYTVLFVKESGNWRYSSVREELEPAITPGERLEELAWMIGDWIDEGSDAVVHASCRWSPDKKFLLRDFTIHSQGKSVMTVNQRIGWDPLTKQLKSWVFDSEGGYGDALWSRLGNQWMIKSTGVLPDGKVATATNILTRIGPNTARWASTERTVGGVHAADRFENTMVRRPPAAGSAQPK